MAMFSFQIYIRDIQKLNMTINIVVGQEAARASIITFDLKNVFCCFLI